MIASGGRGSSPPTPDRESAAVRGHSPTRQGARGYVIRTARSVNHGFLVRPGVDEAFDYTRGIPRDIVPDVDVVLDLVGDETAAQSLPALRDGGIVIGVSSGLMARCGRPATALASPTCSSNPTTRDRGARRRGALRPHVGGPSLSRTRRSPTGS